jgi:hypothetical protein
MEARLNTNQRRFQDYTARSAHAVVSTGAKLDVLGEYFGRTDGPVWVSEGASACNHLQSHLSEHARRSARIH